MIKLALRCRKLKAEACSPNGVTVREHRRAPSQCRASPSTGAAHGTSVAALLEEIPRCFLVIHDAGIILGVGPSERGVEVLVLDAEAGARGVQRLPVVLHVAAQVEIDASIEICLPVSHFIFCC